MKRINRKQYLAFRRELIKEARKYGFEYKFQYNPHNYHWVQYGGMGAGRYINGVCNFLKDNMTVRTYGKPSRSEILFVMAHELRHTIQYKTGLYKNYYTDLLNIKFDTAWRAEQDADKFAAKWLRKRGLDPESILKKSVYSDGNKWFFKYQLKNAKKRARMEEKWKISKLKN